MTEPVTASLKQILMFGDGQAGDLSVEGFAPPVPEHFGAQAQIFIGQESDDRYDSFDVTVCTPTWLSDALAGPDWSRFNRGLRAMPELLLPGASIWLMRRWDASVFVESVTAVCEQSSPGPDWGAVASRIGRLIPWEFDYKYDAHVNQHYREPFPPGR